MTKYDAELPLVSIVVVTYNSEPYVLETLQSAYEQSYQNIELIVTDDGSKDETIEACTQWIEKNKDRFESVKIVTFPENTGITINCNRGIIATKGKWVKLIAGDDILEPNCIRDNIDFVSKYSQTKALFSSIRLFRVENGEKKYMHIQPFEEQKKWFECDAVTQYKQLLLDNFNWVAPSVFCDRELLATYYNENRFPYFDDYPFWLKVTKNGIPLRFMDKITVLYRQAESITRVGKYKWVNENYFKSVLEHFELEVAPALKKIDRRVYIRKQLQLYKTSLLIKYFDNKRTLGAKIFNRAFRLFIP